jgi:hypothetical protein
MTAIILRLFRVETGQPTGWALVCPDARYASVMLHEAAVITRRYADPPKWREMAHEMRIGMHPGPLAATSAIVRLIAESRSRWIAVHWVAAFQIEADPLELTAALDAKLREQVRAP